MSKELSGIIPPIVTPFDEQGEIDQDSLRREIRYHLDAGVHGISVAGSTGEGNALTLDEHSLLYDVAVEEADGSVPVVAGVIATSAQEAASKAELARDSGADYVMATPPHYMTPTDDGLVEYFRVLGERGKLPILIYDVIDHVDVTDSLATRMVEEVPELYGIKQSGGDFHGLSNMLATVGEDLQILTALDDLLYPSFQIGARGAIAGVNAIYPRLSVELWDAVQNGDTERAEELHFATHRLARDAVWDAQVNFPGGVKTAIDLLGREAGEARTPIHRPDGEKRAQIRDAIDYMHGRNVYEDPDRA